MSNQRRSVFTDLFLKTWARCVQSLLGGLLLLSFAPAHAQTQVFFDNFAACGGSGGSGQYDTAVALNPPIKVDLFLNSTADCSGWNFAGPAWLAVSAGGTPFPNGATKAIWLNEEAGSMSRTLTGLTVGNAYRLSAKAWTDNVDAATALGLVFGSVTTNLPMSAGSGPQDITAQLCASSPTMNMSLYENGDTGASPVVTNILLEDLNTPCGGARPAPVPVGSMWMLALLSGLVLLLFAAGKGVKGLPR